MSKTMYWNLQLLPRANKCDRTMHRVMPSDHIIHACYLITVFMDVIILFMHNRISSTHHDPSWWPSRLCHFRQLLDPTERRCVYVACCFAQTAATMYVSSSNNYVSSSNNFALQHAHWTPSAIPREKRHYRACTMTHIVSICHVINIFLLTNAPYRRNNLARWVFNKNWSDKKLNTSLGVYTKPPWRLQYQGLPWKWPLMSVEFGAETAKTAGVTVRDSPGRSFNFVASTS